MRCILVILINILLLGSIYAQYDTLAGRFIHFDNENGLNTNSILSTAQDDLGFIWVSTADGLYRFDGYSFQNVNEFINAEFDFQETSKIRYLKNYNKIAISASNGLILIDEKTYSVEQISSLNIKDIHFSKENAELFYVGYDLLGRQKNVLGSYNCISKLQETLHENLPKNIDVVSFSTNHNKVILGGDSLYTYSIAQKKLYNEKLNSKLNQEDLFIQDIISDSIIYIASWGHGLIKYDYENRQTKSYTFSLKGNSKNYNGLRHLNKVNEELIYISTADRGVGTFNLKSEKFSFYIYDNTDPSSITEISARESMLDRQGNLWVSMAESLSLKSIDRNFADLFSFKFNNYNRDITELHIESYKDSIICQCATNYGKLITYDLQGRLLNIPFEYNIDQDFACIDFAELNDVFFALDRNRIYRIDFDSKQIHQEIDAKEIFDKPKSLQFHSIASSKSALYIKGWNEIYKFELIENKLKHTDTYNTPKANQIVVLNNILYYSDPKHLYQLNQNNQFEIIQPLSEKHYDATIDPMYLSTSLDRYIVIGTLEKGVIIYDTKNNTDTLYNINSGLKTNKIARSTSDKYGNIWMLSSGGLALYNKSYESFSNFTEEDGVFSTDLLPDFISTINGDKVVISVDYGINVIDVDKMNLQEEIQAVKIYSVNGIPVTNQLIFNPETVTVDIRFSNFNYGDNGDYKFEYKINEEEWRPTQSNGNLVIIAAEPQEYIVSIRGIDAMGRRILSDTVSFTIQKKWYQTIWFLILCFALAIGLSGYIYYLISSRKKVALEIENEYKLLTQELENQLLRSQMNPHFLFNSLNSIRYFILNQETDKAANYLSKFSRLIRLILENSRKVKVPLKDELKMIELYIHLEQVRFEKKFDFELDLDKNIDIETTNIPSMLIQPFLENAILHGINPKKSKAKLLLKINKKSQNILLIQIIDDGIGRKKSSKIKDNKSLSKKSLGMNITEKRLQLVSQNLNKEINVSDLNPEKIDTGTLVSFEVQTN